MVHKSMNKIWKFRMVILVVFLAITLIQPASSLFAYFDEPLDIQLQETMSQDQTIATLTITIEERDGAVVESIVLPDNESIQRESLLQDEQATLRYEFQTKQNEVLTFHVLYRQQQIGTQVWENRSERMEYEVKGIIHPTLTDNVYETVPENLSEETTEHRIQNVEARTLGVGVHAKAQHMFVGDQLQDKLIEGVQVFGPNMNNEIVELNAEEQLKLGNLEIRTSMIDETKPGFHKVRYVFNVEVVVGDDIYIYFTEMIRDVYIHGTPVIVYNRMNVDNPDIVNQEKNVIAQVGDEVNVLRGVSAYYMHTNKDKTYSKISVPVKVEKGNALVTSDYPGKKQVEISAEANIEFDNESQSYTAQSKHSEMIEVDFYGKPHLCLNGNMLRVSAGSMKEDILQQFNVHASITTPKGITEDLSSYVTLAGKDEEIDFDKVGQYDAQIVLTSPYELTFQGAQRVVKDVTIIVVHGGKISAPDVNIVEGDSFDLLQDVEIINEQNEKITTTIHHIQESTIPGNQTDSVIETTKRGQWIVVYQYVDKHQNTLTFTRKVNVHGKLQVTGNDPIYKFANEVIGNKEMGRYVPASPKAYYYDAANERKDVDVEPNQGVEVKQWFPSEDTLLYPVKHPVNKEIQDVAINVTIYSTPQWHQTKAVNKKVGQEVRAEDHVWVTYKKINRGIEDTVTIFPTSNPWSSNIAVTKNLAYELTIEDHGASWSGSTNLIAYIDGFPQITSPMDIEQMDQIILKENTMTLDQLKEYLNLSASKHKADGSIQNLTSFITYDNNINFQKAGTYQLVATLLDESGYQVQKEFRIIIEQVSVPQPPNHVEDTNNTNNTPQEKVEVVDKEVVVDKKEKVSYVIITKDISLDDFKGNITKEFLSSFVYVTTKDGEKMDVDIVSNTLRNQPGTYEIVIRLPDGTQQTIKTSVSEEKPAHKEVEKEKKTPTSTDYGVWLILILLIAYMVIELYLITKKRNENMLLSIENETE